MTTREDFGPIGWNMPREFRVLPSPPALGLEGERAMILGGRLRAVEPTDSPDNHPVSGVLVWIQMGIHLSGKEPIPPSRIRGEVGHQTGALRRNGGTRNAAIR